MPTLKISGELRETLAREVEKASVKKGEKEEKVEKPER